MKMIECTGHINSITGVVRIYHFINMEAFALFLTIFALSGFACKFVSFLPTAIAIPSLD